jgi:hypothetical protein
MKACGVMPTSISLCFHEGKWRRTTGIYIRPLTCLFVVPTMGSAIDVGAYLKKHELGTVLQPSNT